MDIIYRAFDGKDFNNEEECLNYENSIIHPNLFTIHFFNKDTKEDYYINKDDIYDDQVYYKADKIIIHNKDEYEDFAWLAKECGWIEFDDINTFGLWERKCHNGILSDGFWIKK